MTHSSTKVDRRIQRTRALLRDALMQLVQEKSYDQITIQDITDTANVARTTFYLHFKDKEELLFETMRDMYKEIAKHSLTIDPSAYLDGDEAAYYVEDFRHVAEYADFYRVMVSENGSPAFTSRVKDYLAGEMKAWLPMLVPAGHEPRIPYDFLAYMMAGAELGVIKWWLDNDQSYEPHQVALMLQSALRSGLIWSLGLDDEAVASAYASAKTPVPSESE